MDTYNKDEVDAAIAHAKRWELDESTEEDDAHIYPDLLLLADEVLRLRAETARLIDEADAVGFRRGVMSAESEIERLRTESKQLRTIAIDITPYLHLQNCEKCGQQKMCVLGARSVGGEKATIFYECEDCAREIKRKYEESLKEQP